MKTWTDKAERGSYSLILLIAWLAKKVGRPPCRMLLYPIVLYFFLTDRTARRASAEFLQTVSKHPVGWRKVFQHIYTFAATLLDRVYMASGEFHRFEVVTEGLPLIDKALSGGRGCLLMGSHLGSFDLVMLARRAMEHRSVGVMMRVDPRAQVRKVAGIDDGALDVIPLGKPDSYLRAYERLKEGGIVALLADRTDGTASLPADFLGRRTTMPIAPHVLAARSETQVLVFFGVYEGENRYRIEFSEFGPTAARDSRGAALQPMIDRFSSLLELAARRYPLNWFNFYPYWGTEKR
jgi:predicted LPLAT superfamily acyltransferase